MLDVMASFLELRWLRTSFDNALAVISPGNMSDDVPVIIRMMPVEKFSKDRRMIVPGLLRGLMFESSRHCPFSTCVMPESIITSR